MTDQPPITGATEVLAILGRPIEHALTPLIVNAALAAAGRDAVQVALSPTPENLEAAVRGLAAAGCRGLTVTIPYKTDVVPFLDAPSESVQATGATNTIVMAPDGRLIGHNTDVDGVLAGLAALPARQRDRAVLLGAGGAARAALAALIMAGFAQVTIANRTVDKARALAADMAERARAGGTALDVADMTSGLETALADADLVVNTTSIGMYPNGEASPVPVALLRPTLDVIDAVYRPNPTRLCRDAVAAGAAAVSGTDWIVAQAIVALRHWFGMDADPRPMHRVLDQFLSGPTESVKETAS